MRMKKAVILPCISKKALFLSFLIVWFSAAALRQPSPLRQWRDHSGNWRCRRGAAQRRESLGIDLGPGDAALSHRGPVPRDSIGRLQEYLAPRLGHPEAVWVFDGRLRPNRAGSISARQYCGRLGKVANCQGGMFLAYVSPLNVGDKGLSPKSWTSDQDRCAAAGVPENRRNYRSKTELALEMLSGLELGYLRAEWVAGETPSGCRRPSGRDWRPWGCARAGPGRHYGLALGPGLDQSVRGSAAPANPSCGLGSGGPWSSR